MTNSTNIPDPAPKPDESSPPVAPLPYEAPIDRIQRHPQVNVLGATASFAFGFCLTAGLVAFVGVFVFIALADGRKYPAVEIFAVLAFFGASAIFAWRMKRVSQVPGVWRMTRWFTLGATLGAGVCCLIEGICFTVAK